VKTLRLLNPLRIRKVAQQIGDVSNGGGPASIRLAGAGHPEGLLVPTARLYIEVKAKDGSVTRFEPRVPIPFPYAWAYRIARRLGVPIIGSLDPERVDVTVPVPGA
jgi:hypothetical protein